MPALLKASMKTAVEAAELLRGGKTTHIARLAHRGRGGIQLGLPGRGVSLGFSSSQLPLRKEEIDLGQRAPVEVSRQRDNRLVFFQ